MIESSLRQALSMVCREGSKLEFPRGGGQAIINALVRYLSLLWVTCLGPPQSKTFVGMHQASSKTANSKMITNCLLASCYIGIAIDVSKGSRYTICLKQNLHLVGLLSPPSLTIQICSRAPRKLPVLKGAFMLLGWSKFTPWFGAGELRSMVVRFGCLPMWRRFL